jgi:hypothetical protein
VRIYSSSTLIEIQLCTNKTTESSTARELLDSMLRHSAVQVHGTGTGRSAATRTLARGVAHAHVSLGSWMPSPHQLPRHASTPCVYSETTFRAPDMRSRMRATTRKGVDALGRRSAAYCHIAGAGGIREVQTRTSHQHR